MFSEAFSPSAGRQVRQGLRAWCHAGVGSSRQQQLLLWTWTVGGGAPGALCQPLVAF
jgi:hypothetical protein